MNVLRFLRGVLMTLLLFALIAGAAVGLLLLLPDSQHAPIGAANNTASPAPPAPAHNPSPLTRIRQSFACLGPDQDRTAAADNAVSLNGAAITPFHRVETGWAVYAPLIAREIGTGCAPDTPGFAAALSDWQKAHSLPTTGRVDAGSLAALTTTWLLRRPFVVAMKTDCPASPNEATLARAAPTEAYGGKVVLARPGALDAYRRMVAAARSEIGVAPPILTIASAYRGPTEEAARCADGSCGGPGKAHCSAHRTGLAFDLYLDGHPGGADFSTTNADRLRLSQTPAYLWLVKNADRFGFVPYPFEPWHWEWTGEPV